MANVLFSRTDSPNTKPITDGQIIFDTSGNGKMYLDNGTTRLEMGGAINVDTTLDANSTNPIQNKGVAGVMLSELEEVRGVTKKGFLTDALATKTLDAKIGTTDISSIGDGTVTGAISDVNGKLDNKNTFIIKSSENEKLNADVVIIKYNKMIQIRFNGFKNITLNTYNTLFVLPDEFKPVSGLFYDCITPNKDTYRITIGRNGVVELFPYTSINNLYNAYNTFVYISN